MRGAGRHSSPGHGVQCPQTKLGLSHCRLMSPRNPTDKHLVPAPRRCSESERRSQLQAISCGELAKSDPLQSSCKQSDYSSCVYCTSLLPVRCLYPVYANFQPVSARLRQCTCCINTHKAGLTGEEGDAACRRV